MPKKINFQSRKFPKAVTFSLYLFGVMAVLIVSFPWLCEIKTKAGINISKNIIGYYNSYLIFVKNIIYCVSCRIYNSLLHSFVFAQLIEKFKLNCLTSVLNIIKKLYFWCV